MMRAFFIFLLNRWVSLNSKETSFKWCIKLNTWNDKKYFLSNWLKNIRVVILDENIVKYEIESLPMHQSSIDIKHCSQRLDHNEMKPQTVRIEFELFNNHRIIDHLVTMEKFAAYQLVQMRIPENKKSFYEDIGAVVFKCSDNEFDQVKRSMQLFLSENQNIISELDSLSLFAHILQILPQLKSSSKSSSNSLELVSETTNNVKTPLPKLVIKPDSGGYIVKSKPTVENSFSQEKLSNSSNNIINKESSSKIQSINKQNSAGIVDENRDLSLNESNTKNPLKRNIDMLSSEQDLKCTTSNIFSPHKDRLSQEYKIKKIKRDEPRSQPDYVKSKFENQPASVPVKKENYPFVSNKKPILDEYSSNRIKDSNEMTKHKSKEMVNSFRKNSSNKFEDSNSSQNSSFLNDLNKIFDKKSVKAKNEPSNLSNDLDSNDVTNNINVKSKPKFDKNLPASNVPQCVDSSLTKQVNINKKISNLHEKSPDTEKSSNISSQSKQNKGMTSTIPFQSYNNNSNKISNDTDVTTTFINPIDDRSCASNIFSLISGQLKSFPKQLLSPINEKLIEYSSAEIVGSDLIRYTGEIQDLNEEKIITCQITGKQFLIGSALRDDLCRRISLLPSSATLQDAILSLFYYYGGLEEIDSQESIINLAYLPPLGLLELLRILDERGY